MEIHEEQSCANCRWYRCEDGVCVQTGESHKANSYSCKYWVYWDIYDREVREP